MAQLYSVDEPVRYWVEANALGWFEKGVLDEADLMEINEAIEAKNAPVEEPVEEEPVEE